MLSDERRKQVREAILQLPERQRLAIALRHAEGLGYREIADAMNLTPKAVERLLARARKSLLSLLLD
ncbi:MAG: ECF RNA polymerase sigma-E factor [candidate division BRC1 bacterium ADurb.BinA364]|nr:MAG: ECF RNA polymerase sigma-E factor [candidate division BRC1 bacterium ADurb.BinA364]